MDYDTYLETPVYSVTTLYAKPGFYTTPYGTIFVPSSGKATAIPSEVDGLLATGNFSLEPLEEKSEESAQSTPAPEDAPSPEDGKESQNSEAEASSQSLDGEGGGTPDTEVPAVESKGSKGK